MERIKNTFKELNKTGRKAFIAYITAGDPNLDSTKNIVIELEKNGVDIIELGIPFSDPVADGPVNQEASFRALASGVKLQDIILKVKEIRKETNIPIVLFSYFNPILNYGLEKFAEDVADSGVDGILILDLPPEEASGYKKMMEAKKIATIFLVSPITPENRLDLIGKTATGFIYYVSQMGVTGVRDSLQKELDEKIKLVKKHTDIPIVIGFGISTPEHVAEASVYADGVVVGSAIVKKIGETGSTPGFEKNIGLFVKDLTRPIKGV